MKSNLPLLPIIWPDRPERVQVAVTTRRGGVSLPPYDELNLGLHVGDDPDAVAQNRALLATRLRLPRAPHWLQQVHGTQVARINSASITALADAAYTDQVGQPLCILTADCLPVLITSEDGWEIGAAHAGWRGLCDGVLEALVAQFKASPGALTAWLGPAIGAQAFEVGPEVRAAFLARHAAASSAFSPSPNPAHPERWLADIYALARLRLRALGVEAIFGGEHCTVTENDRFYSYRRDGVTGRMASLIWL
ncbi:MAG: peptidoglycan editing factor PgeF [Natronospirillum sp.]